MTFKDQLQTDLPVFFNESEFGEEAIVDGTPISCLFDDGSEGDRWKFSPQITAREADLGPVPYGAPVSVRGVAYIADAYRPDGHGVAILTLRVPS